MQSVLTKGDTTNILLSPSHLTSHNDILREVVLSCRFADCVPTVRPTACLAAGREEKCCAGRLGDPACVCVFVVMSSVTTARSRCDFTDEGKVITRQLVPWPLPEHGRFLINKFQRCLSYFQMGTRQRFPLRGYVGIFT